MSETRFITVPVGVFQVSYQAVSYHKITQWTHMALKFIQQWGSHNEFQQYSLKTLFQHVLEVEIPQPLIERIVFELSNPSVPLLMLPSATMHDSPSLAISQLTVENWEKTPIQRYIPTNYGREVIVNGKVKGNPADETAVIEYDFVRQEARLLERNGKEYDTETQKSRNCATNIVPNPILQEWCQDLFPRDAFQKVLALEVDDITVEKVRQTTSTNVKMKGYRTGCTFDQQRGRTFIRFKDSKIEEGLTRIFTKSQLENIIRKEIAQ